MLGVGQRSANRTGPDKTVQGGLSPGAGHPLWSDGDGVQRRVPRRLRPVRALGRRVAELRRQVAGAERAGPAAGEPRDVRARRPAGVLRGVPPGLGRSRPLGRGVGPLRRRRRAAGLRGGLPPGRRRALPVGRRRVGELRREVVPARPAGAPARRHDDVPPRLLRLPRPGRDAHRRLRLRHHRGDRPLPVAGRPRRHGPVRPAVRARAQRPVPHAAVLRPGGGPRRHLAVRPGQLAPRGRLRPRRATRRSRCSPPPPGGSGSSGGTPGRATP